MDWKEIKLEDLMPMTPERQKEWQETLDKIHEQQKAADRDRHKVIVGWSSPSGLIPYAKPQ